jgi:hypothetical protein
LVSEEAERAKAAFDELLELHSPIMKDWMSGRTGKSEW